MQCKNCKSSFAQHELTLELTCLKCTAKELANARVHEAHLEDGLRAAEGELATVKVQLADALARERQLRETLGYYAGLNFNSACAQAALTTPAPRVFTLADVQPLVEALDRIYRNALIADGVNVKCVDTIWLRQEGAKAMQHARKLGMEDA